MPLISVMNAVLIRELNKTTLSLKLVYDVQYDSGKVFTRFVRKVATLTGHSIQAKDYTQYAQYP